jgi:O-antigen/teichoic acid export membrane protein
LDKRKIFSDYVFNLLRTVLNVAMPMITLPFVLNRIGPENYGIFSYSNSIISYFTMAAVLGIPTYASREIARVKGTDQVGVIASEIYVIQFISVTVACLVFYLGFFPLFPDEQKTVFLLLSILIGGNFFNTEWFFIGEQRFKFIAVRSMVVKILNVAAILMFIKEGDNCNRYALISALTGLGNGLANMWGIIPRFTLKNLRIKRHIKPVFVLFALSITGMINSSIDKTLTGVLVGPLYVGFYTVGFRITRIIQQVFTAMNSIIFPRVTQTLVNEGEDKSMKLITFNMDYILMFSWPILLGLSLYARDIILLLFEPELLPAATALIILTGTVPVIAILNVVRQQVLLARDKDKVLIVLTIITTISNICFNLLLVPSYQHNGAAVATLMAESSGLIFGLLYIQKKFSINLFKWSQMKYMVATPVLLIPYYLLNPLKDNIPGGLVLTLQILISMLFFFAALFFLKDDFFYRYLNKIMKKLNRK